jgi:metallo-beta-lactamase family protein
MKVTFIGATHEVTGSCTLIENCGKYGLVDFGMEQGKDVFENAELPVAPGEISFLLLTHAHIDHSGLIPLLYKNGFQGKIYTTEITEQLCAIMLRDSAHIQESEAEWKNRKNARAGKEIVEPLYDVNDVEGVLGHFVGCQYGREYEVSQGVRVRFTDVGHLLGSSCVEIWLEEKGISKKIVFSGDVGNTNQPIIKDPGTVREADYVVIESTYGDRYHGERPDHVAILAACIQKTLDRGGNVVIPSFAVGRTQEMLYFIRQIKEQGLVKGHPNFPVYMDSPLANEATTIFQNCDISYLDEEAAALVRQGINPLVFPNLKKSITSEDSKAINFDEEPKVIISASGMCDAGRIRHHLKHNLWRRECLILFVGYQAVGTPGRAIFDGAKSLRFFGEEVTVNAEINYMPGISGHADKNGLIAWLEAFEKKPEMVFVNHGDELACESFTKCITEEYGYTAYAPYSGTEFDLATGQFLAKPAGVRIAPKALSGKTHKSQSFAALMSAADRLMEVLRSCEGMSNKELNKYTKQLEQLADQWSR